MADIADVEQAVADSVTAALYPQGAFHASAVGALCRVYRGWPNAATLNADLSAGAVNVTVVSDNDSGRTTTRYLPRWHYTPIQPGATMNVSGQTIAISGSPTVGDIVGAIVDGVPYTCRVGANDSPAIVASNLELLIQADRPARARGPNILIPGARSIAVRVVCDSPASFETRRQEKDLRIICWCFAPDVRDAVAATVDAAIDQIEFLHLQDQTQARIVYKNTVSYDQAQNALLYRRDLIYTVEYPTITTVQQPSMIIGASDLNSNITFG
jgi:hypothetical protein